MRKGSEGVPPRQQLRAGCPEEGQGRRVGETVVPAVGAGPESGSPPAPSLLTLEAGAPHFACPQGESARARPLGAGRCHTLAHLQVRAGESLMKLVSDLKQFLILNDFPSVNDAIDQRDQQLRGLQEECDRKLVTLRDEVAIDLYELEEEYYSSRYK